MREKLQMSCNKFDQYGILYLYDELNPDKLRFFREHLQSCEKCGKLIAELKSNKKLYSALPEDSPPQKLLFRINLEAKKQTYLNRIKAIAQNIQFRQRLAPAFVAIVVLVLISISFFHQFETQPVRLDDKHFAWSNGIDSEIDSLNLEIDIFYPKLLAFESDTLQLYPSDPLGDLFVKDLRMKKIEQDIDILSISYEQLNF